MPETAELRTERIFDAPLEKVWAAWTDPEQLGKWWGPKGFTSSDNKIDLREGGSYNFHMHAPEDMPEIGGMDLYSGGEIKEIVPKKRLVYLDNFTDRDGNKVPASTYGMDDDFPQDLVVTVEFEEVSANKTKMTMTHAGMPASDMADQTSVGWNESFDKLAESLT